MNFVRSIDKYIIYHFNVHTLDIHSYDSCLAKTALKGNCALYFLVQMLKCAESKAAKVDALSFYTCSDNLQ